MRSLDELQRAHDLLWPLVMEEVPFPIFSPTEVCGPLALHACLDVLCWALGPEHNDANRTFADNMARIERLLASHGIALKKGRSS